MIGIITVWLVVGLIVTYLFGEAARMGRGTEQSDGLQHISEADVEELQKRLLP